MQKFHRSFEDPDETLEFDRLESRVVYMGGMAVAHNVHGIGWRWSDHLKSSVGTEWCEAHHVGYVVSGRFRFGLRSGDELEVGPGEVFDIPAGHDGWVIGDQPCETIEWTGARTWLPDHEMQVERAVTTLVFTDIVGSTDAAQRLGPARWSEVIRLHEDRARDVIARFRGREVKQTGDGVLAMFDSAVRAVRAAQALRDAAEGLDLKVRTGVHTGEVEVADADIRGIAVHEAARIMSLAEPSEVLVSSTTHSLADESGLEFEDRGQHLLRGIPGPRHLFRLI